MEPNLRIGGREPMPDGTLAQRTELRNRLKRVPFSWIDPSTFSRPGIEAGCGLLSGRIVQQRKGILERVRWSSETSGIKLLLNEYEALQAVQHENVVTLRWARRQHGTLSVATSWRESPSTESAPHPLPWLLTRMTEAARGVAAIHRAGLVHGDLKPATILMGETWTLVNDLKCATPPGRRKGSLFTPKFAAPEQVLGDRVGPAADVYALGMTLYTLFIKDRFPLILRGAQSDVSESDTVVEDEAPALSSATSLGLWSTDDGHGLAMARRAQPRAAPSPDFIIGVKVRFRSQLGRVLEGVQHAGWVGEVLRLVRTATQIDPSERFKTCEEFEAAICDLAQRLPK